MNKKAEQEDQIENVAEGEVSEPDAVVEENETDVADDVTPDEDTTESEAETDDDASEGDLVIAFGDESPPSQGEDGGEGKEAPKFVKDLRKKAKDDAKRIRDLERQLEAKVEAAKPLTLPTKPTMKGADYDDAKFEAQMDEWFKLRSKYDEQEAARKKADEDQQKAWQERQGSYKKAAQEMGVDDFDDAEDALRSILSPTQQGILLDACDKPEMVVYALGMSPERARKLAEIKNPVKFTVAVSKMESGMKVTRRAAPKPEKRVKGGSGNFSTPDAQLEKLEAEAERTGDRTAILKFKRDQRKR